MQPYIAMDSASDSDGDHEQQRPAAAPRRARQNPQHLPLHQFLRLIAGGPMVAEQGGAAASNADLVANLQRAGVIETEATAAALRCCARDLFVPEEHHQEAFMDAPIRLENLEINISAPHMHATMIEALEVRAGHAVLDVGSGCGIVAAACALLAGKDGQVVGIDVRRECCELARAGVARVAETCPEWASSAAPCTFECANAFLLAGTHHVGRYDIVHVGASCPPDALLPLLHLLKEGGRMVVPVSPSDLRIIVKKENGKVRQRVISQVRFSDLEVPSESDIVLAAMRADRKARTSAAPPLSTFDADVAAIAAARRRKTPHALSTSPAGVIEWLPPSPTHLAAATNGLPISPAPPLAAVLGAPDCSLVQATDGWAAIPAHREVLCQRCDLLRARCNSGMADAELSTVAIPDHFSRPPVVAFLGYLYSDRLECDSTEKTVEVLHIAQYFGVPRCAALCEYSLAKVLKSAARSERTVEAAADAAASLLVLANDQGLEHLQAVSADFIVAHHGVCAQTEGYVALSRDQVAVVAAEACRQLSRAKELLQEMQSAGEELMES